MGDRTKSIKLVPLSWLDPRVLTDQHVLFYVFIHIAKFIGPNLVSPYLYSFHYDTRGLRQSSQIFDYCRAASRCGGRFECIRRKAVSVKVSVSFAQCVSSIPPWTNVARIGTVSRPTGRRSLCPPSPAAGKSDSGFRKHGRDGRQSVHNEYACHFAQSPEAYGGNGIS